MRCECADAEEILIAALKLHGIALDYIRGIGVNAEMGGKKILIHILLEVVKPPILPVDIDGNEAAFARIEIQALHRLARKRIADTRLCVILPRISEDERAEILIVVFPEEGICYFVPAVAGAEIQAEGFLRIRSGACARYPDARGAFDAQSAVGFKELHEAFPFDNRHEGPAYRVHLGKILLLHRNRDDGYAVPFLKKIGHRNRIALEHSRDEYRRADDRIRGDIEGFSIDGACFIRLAAVKRIADGAVGILLDYFKVEAFGMVDIGIGELRRSGVA